ncbi:MAG: FN3 domain-containing metallophosphoesterase family protein [Candidatus Cryptobacteroides sp.]|nr:FN3 domain-containing metallophosphoesterase family protein [Bacteroidales bacterium]MDY2706394.1 FN3 domain-containing metallophosphoesterase family protein [Candidatus Cryptobacteroides sp.]MDY5744095.1 FN3 domain-containing metallophosphoesterase family protein [Candidatus Cryptobacteroides sp.]
MKKIHVLALMIVLWAGTVNAQKPQRAKIVCGPYVQCMTETSFTVIWTTDVDAVAWVEVAPDDGTHFYNKERDKYYDARGNGVFPIGKIHKVVVDGLEPGSTYRYRVMNRGVIAYNGSGNVQYMHGSGTDVYKGEPHKITTFKEDYDTIRFDLYNDIHGKDSLFNRILSGARDNRDFVFLNGDMTSNISNEELIPKMYLGSAAKSLNGGLPLFASRGNHELRGRDAIKWLNYFQTTTGTPYYSFSIGDFFFVVLDACEDKPDSDIEYSGIVASKPYVERQGRWLKEVIASEECRNAKVRIAFCHVPPESKGWYGAAQMCNILVPPLNEAGFDAMFCGHIHRWRVAEPDGSISNAGFPVICNANMERMEVTATEDAIEISTFDTDGKNTHNHTLKLKK